MHEVERLVDRALMLLQQKIRGRGFTQLDIQQTLGWGRSYISQLVTKQKALRVEQVLLILQVIGVEPAEYFSELFQTPEPTYRGAGPGSWASDARRTEEVRRLADTDALLDSVVELLLKAGLFTRDELSAAIQVADRE